MLHIFLFFVLFYAATYVLVRAPSFHFLYIVHSSTTFPYACTAQISFNDTMPHIL